MTDQPDTAAIRANYGPPGHPHWRDLVALCDALDAARAELAANDCCDSSDYAGHAHVGPDGCGYQHCHCPGGTPGTWSALESRAEAAEARITELEGRVNELEQLADPELDARWCAVWQEVCDENAVLEARIAAALALTVAVWVDSRSLRRALTGDYA